MRFFLTALLLAVLVSTGVAEGSTRPSQDHEVYFAGTDYELHVYKINGRRDGKTVLILGGIQGDEPGGHLSADLYSNLRLEQGNLIVIPRASLKSVILYNRGIDGDMNRLFVDDLPDTRLDYQVVKVVMAYMGEADMFLNLHDGWGFHSPTYINEQRNPKRFGQSLIVDEDIYTCEDGTELKLQEMAIEALRAANARIDNKDHHLAYFNTRTGDPNSPFKGMEKTATWYALRNYCIPAFGIESSKNIKSVELKVLYHNYVINELLAQVGVIPEYPPVYFPPAALEHALVTVNGESTYVSDGDVIKIRKGDVVAVKHVEANYSTGVSCDILGFGNLNDLHKEVAVGYTTKVIFRKEDKKFAEITLEVMKDDTPVAAVIRPADGYRFELVIDGRTASIEPETVLELKEGTIMNISRLLLNGEDTKLPVNLRGWVPGDISANDGDDRGYDVVVAFDAMIKRYSTEGTGEQYPVTVDKGGKELVRMYIKIIK